MSAAPARRARFLRPGEDRRRTLVTPEGIVLNFTLATRGARLGALVVDLILIGVAMLGTTVGLIYLAGGVLGLGPAAARGDALGHALQFLFVVWIAAMFLFRNAWFLFFELSPRGATPGKRMSGIRIAARDGGRLTAEMVLARNLLRDIELFLPVPLLLSARDGDMGGAGLAAAAWFLVFMLLPCFNRDALRAGDLIAGTWVVEAPRPRLEAAMTARQAPRGAAAAEYRFGEAELSVYGEYELQVLERVLRENRPDALAAVHERICAKIGWHPGHGDERAFLEAFYTQLRARLESGMRMGKRKADKHASIP